MNLNKDMLRVKFSFLRHHFNQSVPLIAKSFAQSLINNQINVSSQSLACIVPSDRLRLLNMSCLCRLSYMADEQTLIKIENLLTSDQYFPEYAFQKVHFLQSNSTISSQEISNYCGYIAITKNENFVVLRGTKNIQDWLTNLLITPNSEGFHEGFLAYTDTVWNQLQQLRVLSYNNHKRLILVGHSLGGAVIQLIAYRLGIQHQINSQLKPSYSLEVYTFGAPPVSTQKLMINAPSYRLRTSGDLVPYCPQLVANLFGWMPYIPSYLANYQHFDPEYLINQNYQIYHLNPSESSYGSHLNTLKSLFTQISLPKNDDDFRKFIRNLAINLYEEHRILSYIQKLNYGSIPDFLLSQALSNS